MVKTGVVYLFHDNFRITIDYTETFCTTLSRVTIWVNFLYITPFRRNRKKLSLYHAQKRVSQISLLQTTSFKETDHRILLEFYQRFLDLTGLCHKILLLF